MGCEYRITKHAIDRYMARVEPGLTRAQVIQRLREFLATARRSQRARWWTSRLGEWPATIYLYSASNPGVCLVAARTTVVTVQDRRECARWRAELLDRQP